jgi:hypothetical protein
MDAQTASLSTNAAHTTNGTHASDGLPTTDGTHFVTLIELAQFYAAPVPGRPSAPPDRRRFHEQLEVFRQQVTRTNGGSAQIRDYFFCPVLPGGAVLTGAPDDRLYITFPPDARCPPWIAQELVRSVNLYVEVREIIRRQNRVICLEIIFTMIVQLLRLMVNENWRHSPAGQEELRSQAGLRRGEGQTAVVAGPVDAPLPVTVTPSELTNRMLVDEPAPDSVVPPSMVSWSQYPWPDLQKIYSAQVSDGWELVRRIAERQAQVDYFIGMLIGAGVLFALVGIFVLLGLFGDAGIGQAIPEELRSLPWLCPLAGGVGAIVSVMQRMSNDECKLRYRAGRFALILVGAFRPIIGSVLASVIVALLASNIMPMRVDQPAQVAFYGVASFLAGFSERWAQDMLGTGKAQLLASSEPERRAAAT